MGGTFALAHIASSVWRGITLAVQARVVTVTTADNLNPPVGQKSLLLALPELPDGFMPGRNCLGTFQDNGPVDADPARGRFDFDISGLGV